MSVRRMRESAATPRGGFGAVPGEPDGSGGTLGGAPCLVANRVPADGEERLNCHRRRDVATCRQDARLALPELSDASYQRSTRSALKVFHRLEVPSGSSNRKWTAPAWVFSSSQRPSGRRLARTRSIASASRGSGVPPRWAKYSVAFSRS